MKKIFTLFVFAAFAASTWAQMSKVDSLEQRIIQLESEKQDQELRDKVWRNKASLILDYGSVKMDDETIGLSYKSKYSASFGLLFKQIRFHKKLIANMMYIGMDLGYSFTVTQYNVPESKIEGVTQESEYGEGYQYGSSFEEAIVSGLLSSYLDGFDLMQIEPSLIVGPSVHVAPLTSLGGAWRNVKVFGQYHLRPTYTMFYNDGDFSHGFGMNHSIGVGLGFKALSVGYEYRFGSTKSSTFSLYGDDEDDNGEKSKFKTKSNRVFVRIRF